MSKASLVICVLAVAAGVSGAATGAIASPGAERLTQPEPGCTVPKAYGSPKLVVMNAVIVFEDANGKLRFVDMVANCRVSFAITRE